MTKEFYVNVDDAIPNGTVVEFNLNIAQKYEPYRSWNHTFTLKYVTDVEIADTYYTLYSPMPMKIPANVALILRKQKLLKLWKLLAPKLTK